MSKKKNIYGINIELQDNHYGESPLLRIIKAISLVEIVKKIRRRRIGMTYNEIKAGCMDERKLDTTGIEDVGKSFTLYRNGEFKPIL